MGLRIAIGVAVILAIAFAVYMMTRKTASQLVASGDFTPKPGATSPRDETLGDYLRRVLPGGGK